MNEFKTLLFSPYYKELIVDVDCKRYSRFMCDGEISCLTTRLAIKEDGRMRVIWSPDKAHREEVWEEALDRLPELLKRWQTMHRAYELRKKATMEDRIFSPASASTRLI